MTDERKVWIMTVPVLCTSHIPPDQIDQLEDPNSVAHDLGGDGYLIFCGEHGDIYAVDGGRVCEALPARAGDEPFLMGLNGAEPIYWGLALE